MNKLGGKNKKSSGSHKYEDDTVLERFEKKDFRCEVIDCVVEADASP